MDCNQLALSPYIGGTRSESTHMAFITCMYVGSMPVLVRRDLLLFLLSMSHPFFVYRDPSNGCFGINLCASQTAPL